MLKSNVDTMDFECSEHGVVETIEFDGYSIGHSTGRGDPNELDLEGITFVFDIEECNEDGVSLDLVDADDADDYLSKFTDWEETITETAEGMVWTGSELHCGRESGECKQLLRVRDGE